MFAAKCWPQSPAMDIQSASNFERLYFEGVRHEGLDTARAMRAFADTAAIDIPPQAMAMIRDLFRGMAVDEAETVRTMDSTFNTTGELIDPHTAVALAAAFLGPARRATPLVALSTAHPAKFPDTVLAATGVEPPLPPLVRALNGRAERTERASRRTSWRSRPWCKT